MFTQNQVSIEKSFVNPRSSQALSKLKFNTAMEAIEFATHPEGLLKRGIDVKSIASHAMDAVLPTNQTTSSIPFPVQFFQNWLPGFTHIATARRKADDLVGLSTMGEFSDEQVVQSVLELQGGVVPYTDYSNMPISNYNINYPAYSVVRFWEGIQVGVLENERAARVNLDPFAAKRNAAAMNLDIERNFIAFNGYNNGLNNTYGFLTDPNLSAYITVPVGAAGPTTWASKTYTEVIADIILFLSNLRTVTKEVVDPDRDDITLALATAVVDQLSKVSQQGQSNSVMMWLRETYPRVRVVSAPELTAANGGANVAYVYAETVNDMSTDDRRTFMQVVPVTLKSLGVRQNITNIEEGYANATAGVFVKRPYAVGRYTGL